MLQSTGSRRVGHNWATEQQHRMLWWDTKKKACILKMPMIYWSRCVYACAQLRPTVCDPMDCSPSVSSVHGIFQTRVLEQVAVSFSRGSS